MHSSTRTTDEMRDQPLEPLRRTADAIDADLAAVMRRRRSFAVPGDPEPIPPAAHH
jgi:hypothetical protein